MALSPGEIDISLPLGVGVGITLCTVVIHALAVITIVRFVRHERGLDRAGAGFWRDMIIVTGTVLLALGAHLIEIAAWAVVFTLCGEFPHFGAAFYHSAVNYTSLGYGDVVMLASWKLFGPLETADGMLMFGVSTAMLFALVLRLIEARFRDLNG